MSMYLPNPKVGPTGSEAAEFIDAPFVPDLLAAKVERRPREGTLVVTTRAYEGAGIIVHWDSSRCIHSERCIHGAPTVFDRTARPWVNLDGASADSVAEVIDTCPSGALSYTRTDGAPNGRRGRAAGEDPAASIAADGESMTIHATPSSVSVTITPQRDGPLSVRGPVALTQPDGTVEIMELVDLCRCGQSASKPLCDSSHARVGFLAPGA